MGKVFLSQRMRETFHQQLATNLHEIHRADVAKDYDRRASYVWAALSDASNLDYRCGVAIDPAEPDWPVVYIELPGAGQVSWHMPAYPFGWDQHTTPEKYARARQYAAHVRTGSQVVLDRGP